MIVIAVSVAFVWIIAILGTICDIRDGVYTWEKNKNAIMIGFFLPLMFPALAIFLVVLLLRLAYNLIKSIPSIRWVTSRIPEIAKAFVQANVYIVKSSKDI